MIALLLTALLLAPYGDPQVAFRFGDQRIRESSGLVSSSLVDDVVFTHNDSGDEARFFAVGPAGATLVTYVLPKVQARDWEDIARGPDEQGRSSLWLGDIGDNDAVRENGILVHRVREPQPGGKARTVTTSAPTSFRLRYADGPRDAETLLVHPRTGRLYVVTKPLAGTARVYAAPPRLDPTGPNALELVGQIALKRTGTAGGPNIGGLAQLLVTAGDVAPDGSRVALRTYTDLYEWDVPGDDVGAAFAATPTVSALPPTQQGEGLAYSRDGRSILVSTEGAGAPVHRLSSRGAAPAAQAPAATAPVEPGQPEATPRVGRPAAVYAGLALLVVAVVLAARRSRVSRRRRGTTDR